MEEEERNPFWVWLIGGVKAGRGGEGVGGRSERGEKLRRIVWVECQEVKGREKGKTMGKRELGVGVVGVGKIV